MARFAVSALDNCDFCATNSGPSRQLATTDSEHQWHTASFLTRFTALRAELQRELAIGSRALAGGDGHQTPATRAAVGTIGSHYRASELEDQPRSAADLRLDMDSSQVR